MHFRGALLAMSLFISSTIEQTLSEKCALVLSKVEWERLFQSQLKTSHVLPLHPAEDWSELWEKKGSLVQKRQHKHGRGGNYIGAKLVVCLGEEIT